MIVSLIGHVNIANTKYKEVTDVKTLNRSEAQVVPVPVPIGNARQNARRLARRNSCFFKAYCDEDSHLMTENVIIAIYLL